MPKYSETHHLNVDENGQASVHVAVRLQDANPQIAHLLVLRVLDAASAVAAVPEQGVPGQVIRPQEGGPCVHIDSADDDDPDAVQALGLACRQHDGACPHLDDDVLCPVKDACSAVHKIARMRDACEAEQEEQDADMTAEEEAYKTETPAIADPGRLHTYVVEPEPEFPEPVPEEELAYEPSPLVGEMRLDARGWTLEQERAMCGATTPAEAVALYRAAYPDSVRTDAAIKTRYHLKIRPQRGATPAPDFAGDTVPVTQHEEIVPDETDPEPTPGKGFYGDARALHADMMDGMMCDRPLSPEPRGGEKASHPWLGMRVRVLDPLDLINRTGTVIQYSLDPREMLVALDNSLDRIWLPPESLVLIGAGRRSP